MSFFTISRISLADGKTARQKVHRKIAIAVQKSKNPSTFCPALLKSAKQIVINHTSGELSDSLRLNNQTG
jgi:hypothetical protein